jgi:hypothetical protein
MGTTEEKGFTPRWNGDGSWGCADETKAAMDELAEVGAVAKGGDDRGLGDGFCRVGDTEIGSEERDEVSDNDLLGLKSMKQLVARQRQRGVMEAGGEAPNWRGRRNQPRTAPRHGQRGSWDFLFYMRSAQEEGNVDNAARKNRGGISMVHR